MKIIAYKDYIVEIKSPINETEQVRVPITLYFCSSWWEGNYTKSSGNYESFDMGRDILAWKLLGQLPENCEQVTQI